MREAPPNLAALTQAAGLADRFVADAAGRTGLGALMESTPGLPRERLRGRSVLVSSARQIFVVRALLQLDGMARRLVLCPPDLPADRLPTVLADAQVDAVVDDGTGPAANLEQASLVPSGVEPSGVEPSGVEPSGVEPSGPGRPGEVPVAATEWLLFTSGTSGQPKLVAHDLRSLTGPLAQGPVTTGRPVWSTFYDIRRYGGLQILLRALLGGGSMVLSEATEPVAAFLDRAGAAAVTHMSGTPSHWRRALMSAATARMAPRYVRLSGEVADQAILNQLAAAYPNAAVVHAFASTEAGVAFDVRDGRAGFPAELIDRPGPAELRVRDGSLRIRSERTAHRYLGAPRILRGEDGFVDTGDLLERRGDRYFFVGRREGVINVGGQKVHPEEVEAVINRHAGVQMARVRGRPSPITGALVVADIVMRPSAASDGFAALSDEVLATCRAALPAHKVPAMLRQVASLDIGPSGKLLRHRA